MSNQHSTATDEELQKWKVRFKLFFYGTPIIVILFFVVQILATKGSFSSDFSSIENWKTFTKTFNLPISIFTAMAAITTLIGMYYRSLQLAHQLSKVESQIEIANNQFKKSEEQFELAQQQFSLATRKENFTLYLEHKKAVENKVEIYLNSLVRMCDALMAKLDFVPAIDVHYDELYESFFPQNKATDVTHFALEVKEGSAKFAYSKIESDLKKVMSIPVKEIHINYLTEINIIYSGIGIHFDFNSYPGEDLDQGGVWLASFFLDVMRATMVLKSLGVLDSKNGSNIQDSCIELVLNVMNIHAAE